MKYPLSWRQAPDSGPGGLVQVSSSDSGHGSDISLITMRPTEGHITPEELPGYFTENFALSRFNQPKSKVLSFTPSTLPNGAPMGLVSADTTLAGVEAHTLYLYFIHKDTFITITFSSALADGPSARVVRLKELQPLIDAIIGSITFSD